MGKYDIAVCKFLSDNDRFAELVNVSEFGGRSVLRGDMLEADDGRYAVLRPNGKQNGKHTQPKEWFRDIKKRTKNGDWIAITAIENQENIDYSMPLRMLEYDLLEYNAQVREIKKDKAKTVQDSGKQPCDWNTHLDKETAETIAIITDSTFILERLDEYETGGEYNMCKAMDDLKADLQAKELVKNICSLMKTMKLTVEQAMDALEVPEEDRGRYIEQL